MKIILPMKKTVLISIGLGVLFAMWLPRSTVYAQTWQKVGNYPNGDPGFEYNLTDASLYSLNGNLYAIVDDRYTQVEVYRLDGSDWNKIGGFGDAYSGAYKTGKAMAYYQNNLYAAVRHVEREIIRPDGDVTTQWNVIPGPDHYTAIDEPILPPGGDTSDYIEGTQWEEDKFSFENVSNSSTSIGLIVYLYAKGTGNFNQADLDIYYDGSLQKTREIDMPQNTYEWMSVPWANLPLTQAQLNSLEIRITPKNAARTYYVATLMVDVFYGSSLKAYKYVSDNNWSLLGSSNLDCDTSSSAYFNCDGSAITGFTGFGGNLYVGTGKNSPSKAQVYRWDGSSWEKYAEGGYPNPAGGIYIPPGGTSKGNVDLAEYNGKLYAGGREDVFIPPFTIIGYTSLYEYVSQNNWTRKARENTNPWGWTFPNARSLVPINGKLAVMGTRAAYSFDGNQTNSMPLIGQYNFGDQNMGMTACGDYLYAGQLGHDGFWGRHTEVWRIDATDAAATWTQVGGDFGNEEPYWHGVHMIASLNDKIYVLTANEEGSPLNAWASVWEYTGAEGTCPPPVSWTIEGTVWADTDLDGVIDASESNRGGGEQVTVTPGSLSAFTTNQGTSPPVVNYSISGTGTGTYTVDVSPLFGWATTTTDPETIVINTSGTYTADFGLVQTGTIQGYIWEDDNDCIRNAGETNYVAASQSVAMTRTTVPVYVYNTCSTASSTGNNFSWSNIMPGDYQVVVGAGCVSGSWPPTGFRETTEPSVTVTLTPGGVADTPTICKNLVP